MHFKRTVTAMAVFLLAGCVSTGTYDEKVAELAACQTARQNDQELARVEVDARVDALRKLESELGLKSRDIEACQKAAEAGREYNEKLNQREIELRSKLQKELSDKDVTISRLKEQLSVQVLDKILFKTGRADIQQAGQAVLEKLAAVLKDTDDMIRVEGHTDNVPIGAGLREKYFSNWELSGARAASVVRFFQDKGQINALRLEPVGFGEFRPVAPNDTEANKQRNRRVEIVLTAVKPTAEAEPSAPVSAPAKP